MTHDELEHGPASDQADRLLAATLYLMSCHARNRCPRLACMIERHLEHIARHDGVGAHVGDTARRLAAAWEAVRRHDEAAAARARVNVHQLSGAVH
jgi:hypothetical protein